MRQSLESPVLCAKDLLGDPGRLSHVVLDLDDEWQLLSDDDRAEFVSLSLSDALELVPELALLDFVAPGTIAVIGTGPVTWFLESYDLEDLEPAELAVWDKGWDLPYPAELDCSVSPDLAELHVEDPARIRKVYQVTRDSEGTWSFFGYHAEDAEEHYPMLLRDVVALYPDVADVLRAFDATSGDVVWDEETTAWMDGETYTRTYGDGE